jgi:hypothetical protein
VDTGTRLLIVIRMGSIPSWPTKLARSLAVEQGTLNPKVVGSIPTGPTKKIISGRPFKKGIGVHVVSERTDAQTNIFKEQYMFWKIIYILSCVGFVATIIYQLLHLHVFGWPLIICVALIAAMDISLDRILEDR